jgi:hypothetical protein
MLRETEIGRGGLLGRSDGSKGAGDEGVSLVSEAKTPAGRPVCEVFDAESPNAERIELL